MAEDKTDDIMIVVASQEGIYGSYRKTGEKFALTDPAHFSTRWMVNVKTDAERAARYAEQFKEQGGAARSDEEIEAELAVATGRSNAADTKKIARLEKENAELRATVENLKVELANTEDLTGVAEETGAREDGGRTENATTKDQDAPRARRTRRTA